MGENISFNNNEIYEILKNEIINLVLYPGQLIGENEISRRFNVSRTPIREVFKRLEYDNLIKPIRNKGTIITPIDLSKIHNFMYVREKLELAVLEEYISCIQEQDLVKLQILLVKQRKLLEDDSKNLITKSLEFYELDSEFHSLIFCFASKSYIWDTILNNMADYKRYRVVSAEFHDDEHLNIIFSHHLEIYDAISNNDFEKIKNIYKTHIYHGKSLFKKMIEAKEECFVM